MPYLKFTLMDPLNNANLSPEEKIDSLYTDYRTLTAHDPQTTNPYPHWVSGRKEPRQNETEEFLDAFARACAAESKKPEAAALKVERVKVIRLIRNQFVQNPSA